MWLMVAALAALAVTPWVLVTRVGRDEPVTLDTWRRDGVSRR